MGQGMNDLDEALASITQIRSQIAKAAEFRGYGPATLAATGGLGILAAFVQSQWLADPLGQIFSYLTIWVATAFLAVLFVGGEMIWRSRRMHFRLAEEMVWLAIERFFPAGLAGALLTFILVRYAPQSLWMLPGLWQILFSLGLFASSQILPRAIFMAAFWYLGTGLAYIALTSGSNALSPWAMGIPFGGGQLLLAALLSSCPAGADDV
jgi:hypothetical protein